MHELKTPISPDTYRAYVAATTVTLQGILDKIKGCTHTLMPDGRTTVCQLEMANGYSVNGISACALASNYNQALGGKVRLRRCGEQNLATRRLPFDGKDEGSP